VTTCASCGTENLERKKFCIECGAALAASCPACGAALDGLEKFCGECGAPVAAAPSTAVPAPPAGERRLVSVLFADLVGFTSHSESRDPEEVRDLLSRYFDSSRRLIELYGGTVEKFIGDAVMAVWGTPTATEDDAERAVRAGLDLVAAVSALGDEAGLELRARAGVLTGEAAVTLGAVGEAMVAGDLVNSASRVQAAAEPGSLLVGEATKRATEAAIAYESAGSHALKGKEEPASLWRAVRVVSGVRGRLKPEALDAPFVGRQLELRRIKELFHACVDERRAHLASVLGIAGIGKSRLAWEFYKYFDGITETVYWHRGRCLAYGEGVTYWALADMVRMRCRIAEDERPETASERLRATLDEYVPDEVERRFLEPRLAQLLGFGAVEAGDRQELFAAWRLFFERLAAASPVVLVFEDLQWADASLLDFVEHLLEWSRGHPLFVVTLARPELLERRPTWGAGQRSFTSLSLEPLPEPAMEELLAGLVPGLPDGLRAQILARAEGVPLYAVETVRMLLDRGLLVAEGDVYAPTTEIAALEVPETLHALIAARLDGLSAEERRLLQDGAVLGKTFMRGSLAVLTGLPDAELEPLLASLVRKEVLGVQADPTSPEYGQYGFLQDLVRRIAYDTLSKRDRRARHLAAADQLAAALGEEEMAEVIAAHLLAAQEAAPDAADAADLRERARDALVRAAERAMSLAAAAEAQRYFEQAAALTGDPVRAAELSRRAGEMAWRANRLVDARRLFVEAQPVFDEHGEKFASAAVALRLADIDWQQGHASEAIARLEPLVDVLGEGPHEAQLASLHAALGRFLALSDEVDRASPHVDRALSLAELLDLPETLASALNSRAMILSGYDRNYEARILYEGALALALDHDLHETASRAYNNLADLFERIDSFAEAVAACERRADGARRLGSRYSEVAALCAQVSSLVLLGRWNEALASAAEVEARTPTAWMRSMLGLVVNVLCERGDLAEARRWHDSLGAFGDMADAQSVSGYAAREARLLRAEGRLSEALTAAARARAVGGLTGTTYLAAKLGLIEQLEAATALGDAEKLGELLETLDRLRPAQLTPLLRAQRARFRAHSKTGDVDADFREAADLFRQIEVPFYVAVTRLEQGERLRGHARPDEAEVAVEEARAIFRRLGAQPWLERALGRERIGAPS
jgi:class 3 adenylate cyclase/tetratricopeptide (TPR) repeat protein